MATAGSSMIANAYGLRIFGMSLLILAVLQALWILLSGAWRYRADFRLGWSAWLVLGPPDEHSGIHTLPLGMAVIVGGLTGLSPEYGEAWMPTVTAVCLCLAWIFTILCVCRFIGSLAVHCMELRGVDGTWFLVPAAALGTGMATAEFAAYTTKPDALILVPLALAITLAGWTGYWLVAIVAGLRILRFGFGNVPQAPWWISMGCAGLAAAALAHMLGHPFLPGPLRTFLTVAVAVTAVVAIALFIPVAARGLLFMIKSCRFSARAAWPPTFSTAVFALGCTQTAEVLHSDTFRVLSAAAGATTLLFWVITAGWNSIVR